MGTEAGFIFEIQRFALHDGPGIRTVIFLKGCSLRCAWCSNPESYVPAPQLIFDSGKCSNCRLCIPTCREEVLTWNEEKLQVNFASCTACGDCIRVCVPDALRISGYKALAGEIIEDIQRDKPYFDQSGGGVTLSGGEALLQADFCGELLQLVKEEKIHTCVQTAGFVVWSQIEKILPFTDLFLFDFKLSTDDDHKRFTGRSNQLILDNLSKLDAYGAQIILRCPIIPGINDTEDHFQHIVEISNQYQNIKGVEVMPYHNWGIQKFNQIGLTSSENLPNQNAFDKKQEWEDFLRARGCQKLQRN
jgi:glycyl-radical enzyme activating protein